MKRIPMPSIKLIVGLLAAIVLALGVVLMLQGRIDTRNYSEQVTRIIQEQTGRQVTIKGKVSVSLLPRPTIYVPGVELRDADSPTPMPSATVDMIRLNLAPLTVLSEHPQVTGVMLDRPVLELTRAKNDLIHWDWLNAGLLKAVAAGGPGAAVSMDITDGKILYHDESTDSGMQITGINAHASGGAIAAGFTVGGHGLTLNLSTSAGPSSAVPFVLQLRGDDSSTLQLQGSADMTTESPVIKAALNADLPDALVWMKAKVDPSQSLLPQGVNPYAQRKADAPMPLKIAGDWSQQGLSVNLDNLQLQGLNSDGLGNVALAWKDGPAITCDIQFTTLDYNRWFKLISTALQTQKAETGRAYNTGPAQDNPLPKNVQLTLMLAAERLLVDSQVWQKAELSAVMEDASVTVNQFSLALPGESALHLFGIFSPGNAGGLRFEGSVETQGKSLRQALTIFDESASRFPEAGFGPFYIRSNIFVSPEQLRLSEADLRLSDLSLNGGLVTYFDGTPRMEADIRLKGIHFDYFRDVWREEHKKVGDQDFFLKLDKNVDFGWLKKLQTTVDLKIYVDDFTFLERKGSTASFRIFARSGEFGLYDATFNYPNDTVKAGFTLNANGEQPNINLSLSALELNTDYFRLNPVAAAEEKAPAVKPRWSEDIIDMSWMNGFTGTFDMSIGRVLHHELRFDNARFKADFKNDLMTFKDVSFDYWRGRGTILGSLYGGKVPGLSISYTLYDADLHDMLKELVGRENLSGKASISGTFSTSGVNILSWLSQSEAKFNLAARGVGVQGFNLQGAIDAVQVSRTASDVFNSVNMALGNGTTVMSVDGTVNMQGGVLRSPGIRLQSDFHSGDMTGEVRLIPWTMDLSTLFQFPVLSQETVPTMTVQLSGPIDAPTLKTDTSSLEAYVAKRIISK